MKKIFLMDVAALALTFTAREKTDVADIVNGDNEIIPNVRVKTTADLIGTEWNYSIAEQTILDDNGDTIVTIPAIPIMDLTFDNDYAYFTFDENVEAYNFNEVTNELEQITGINFEYSYNGITHIGTLNGIDVAGNVATQQFTYDDATDVITFALEIEEMDGTTGTLNIVFTRSE